MMGIRNSIEGHRVNSIVKEGIMTIVNNKMVIQGKIEATNRITSDSKTGKITKVLTITILKIRSILRIMTIINIS